MKVDSDEYFMSIAISEAMKALEKDEVPVGSIITMQNKIISKGHNSSIQDNDPTAHAEINVIRKASRLHQNYRLNFHTIYTTLEPCPMCLSAIIHSRIQRIVFGAYDFKTGSCGSCFNMLNKECFNHYPEILGGVEEKKCSKILRDFFEIKRS